jgi:hypothetical protein
VLDARICPAAVRAGASRSGIQSRRVVSQPGSPHWRARSVQKTCWTASASPGSSCSCNSGRGSSGSQPVSDSVSRAAAAGRSSCGSASPDGSSQPQLPGMKRYRQTSKTRS